MISLNIYEIIMQMVNFLILYWLLQRFMFKPLSSFLEKRNNTIANDLKEAETNKEETQKVLTEQQEQLRQASVEAKRIRDKAEDAAKKERETVLKQAKEESQKILDNAKKELDQDVKKAKKELLEQVGGISIKLSEKIIGKNLDAKDQEAIITQYLETQPS